MQIKRDELIAHDIEKCHTISLRKQIKGNDSQWLETSFKYLVRYLLGESSVCDARSLPACITYSCYSWLRDLTFCAISRSEDLLFFLKTKAFARFSTEILVFTPWSIMPVAAFSINHICPFKYRTRHSEKDHWKFRFPPRVEDNWKRKQNALKYHKIAQKQSLYNDLFTEFRKNTFRML